MPSVRKALSRLFRPNSEEASQPSSSNVDRASIDSGYHSLRTKRETPATTLVESVKEVSLRKAQSTLFETALRETQRFANTVRSKTSYFYADQSEPKSPFADLWSVSQTPKKRSWRIPIWPSSVQYDPRTTGSPQRSRTEDTPPTVDVEIPNHFLNDGAAALKYGETSTAKAKLPVGSDLLWPGPTRGATAYVSTKDEQIGGHPLQTPEDKGYTSEIETNAENYGSDFSSANPKAMDQIEGRKPSLCPPLRSTISRTDLRYLFASAADTTKPVLCKRASSDVYEADGESSNISPGGVPSMGSRADWERRRADRDQRYRETISKDDDTESGTDSQSGSMLARSPTKKTFCYAEDPFWAKPNARIVKSVESIENIGASEGKEPPKGDLHHAVEANERQSGTEIDLGLRYAVEANERPSGTEFDDCMEKYAQPPSEVWPLSSPENPSSYDIPAHPRHTTLTMRLNAEDIMALAAADLEGQDVQGFWSDSSDVSAGYSPQQRSVPTTDDPHEPISMAIFSSPLLDLHAPPDPTCPPSSTSRPLASHEDRDLSIAGPENIEMNPLESVSRREFRPMEANMLGAYAEIFRMIENQHSSTAQNSSGSQLSEILMTKSLPVDYAKTPQVTENQESSPGQETTSSPQAKTKNPERSSNAAKSPVSGPSSPEAPRRYRVPSHRKRTAARRRRKHVNEIRVQNFATPPRPCSSYAGYEMDSDLPSSSKKGVDFAEDVDIIGRQSSFPVSTDEIASKENRPRWRGP